MKYSSINLIEIDQEQWLHTENLAVLAYTRVNIFFLFWVQENLRGEKVSAFQVHGIAQAIQNGAYSYKWHTNERPFKMALTVTNDIPMRDH